MKTLRINKKSFVGAALLLHKYNPGPFKGSPIDIVNYLFNEIKENRMIKVAIDKAVAGDINHTSIATGGYNISITPFEKEVEICCLIEPHILLLGQEDYHNILTILDC